MTPSPILTIAIGVSADGHAAVISMLGALPAHSGLALVIVQRAGADWNAPFDKLLLPHTAMPVVVAHHGLPVTANHVYVVPLDARFAIADGHFASDSAGTGLRPLDLLFTSLGEDRQERAACIVLADNRNDGTLGLRAIKERGGLTIAQLETGEAFPAAWSVPAGETGLFDATLPAAEIPAFLLGYAAYLRTLRPEDAAAAAGESIGADLGEILRLVQAHSGQDFSGYKDGTLVRRVQRRMHILQLQHPAQYIARLAERPVESAVLLRDFLIGVTEFFRDPKAFASLRRLVMPALGACDGDQPFRAWVPACATGEEVYSLAILLMEAAEEIGSAARIQIFGSDIDDAAITVARAGRYHLSAIASVPAASRQRWFTEREGMMEPTRALRDVCVFSRHNVISDPPLSRMHLISCRNLLIYLGHAWQDQALQTFHYALRNDGFLFLGLSEGIGRSQALFTVADKRNRIFRRSATDVVPPPRPAASRDASSFPAIRDRPGAREDWLARAAHRLMARHSPVYLIIDAMNRVVRFSGGAITDFLDPSPGFASLDLFSLLRGSLRGPVRHALLQAAHVGRTATQTVMMFESDSGPREVTLIVEPLYTPGRREEGTLVTEAPYFVVAFSQGAGRGPAAAPPPDAEGGASHVGTVIAQLEAMNEELRLAGDEHQSMNEELRSANEELEVSREEMQSVNEELQTVNAELTRKNDILVGLNSDFQNLLDSTHIATLFLDTAMRVKSFTPNMADLFSLRLVDVGRPIQDLSSTLSYASLGEDVAQVLQSLEALEREVMSRKALEPGAAPGLAGLVFIMRMRPYRRADDSVDGVVITFIDISARKHAENQVWLQAHHDSLTGLPNRAMFNAILAGDISSPYHAADPAALLCLDLDLFKNVNDTFGHGVGDKVLQFVAERLRRCVRGGEMVCRLGGDEFAIILVRPLEDNAACLLADRLLQEISATYDVDGYSIQISVCIGIAFRTAESASATELAREADIALYAAKRRGGRNWQVFQPAMQQHLDERRDLELGLRQAIMADELLVMYQPIVRLSDRRIVGAEALVRWRHPVRGLLPPGRFITIAEETGIIVDLGAWIMRTACLEAARWPDAIRLSVNVSSIQFSDPSLIGVTREAIAAAALPPSRLYLEMTETVLMEDNLAQQEILAALRAMGVGIALDDFGTGYSSLSYLRKFPIDQIKIDQAFIQVVDDQRESGVIVDAIVAMGKGLGISVCAEGVETDAQLAALERLGIDEAQGYRLHRPMMAEDFSALLAAQV